MKQITILKRVSFLLLTFLMVFTCIPITANVKAAEPEIAINEVNFPDANFRSQVIRYDSDNNGRFSPEEINKITSLFLYNKNISSLKGIEYFHALTSLNCSNNDLTSLDISKNIALTELSCWSNWDLKTLDVSKNINLQRLDCAWTGLEALDVSKNIHLQHLDFLSADIEAIDVSKNTALISLGCGENRLTTLDISKNTLLEHFSCQENELTTLDISKNTRLEYLRCQENKLTTLDISQNTLLEDMDCSKNNLTSLNLSNNTALTTLYCDDNTYQIALPADRTFDLNTIPEFDIAKASKWKGAACSGTMLTVAEDCKNVQYVYDCGNGNSAVFNLMIEHVHNPKSFPAKEATCEEAGRKAYYQCTGCKEYFEDANCKKHITENIYKWRHIPEKAHKHTLEKESVTKASPYQNGVIIQKCKTCDYIEDEIIASPENITLSADAYSYNGRSKKPAVSVSDSNGKAIASKYFDVTYAKGRKNVGTYEVTVTFKGDCYTGKAVKTFTINPKNTRLKKPSAGRKSITVKWKKLRKKMRKSRISGYQIQYSRFSSFKNAKMKKVKGYETTSKTLTKLKAKKKYYVRIRTYMTVNKTTYYSSWSKAKTVKTR